MQSMRALMVFAPRETYFVGICSGCRCHPPAVSLHEEHHRAEKITEHGLYQLAESQNYRQQSPRRPRGCGSGVLAFSGCSVPRDPLYTTWCSVLVAFPVNPRPDELPKLRDDTFSDPQARDV